MEYEICYLVGESKEGELEKIKEEVNKIIAQEGATVLEPEKVEKRKLAYKVQKEIRGIYVAKHFEIKKDDEATEEKNEIGNITRKLNLKNDVLRFIIVKADEVPALMKEEAKEEERIVEKKPVRAAKQKVESREKSESTFAKATADKEKPKAKKDEIDDELDKLLNI